jgi:hypothetical protein
MNVKQLKRMLEHSDVQIVAHSQTFDIAIAAPLSWTSGSRLTVDGYGLVEIEAPVTVAGTGAVSFIDSRTAFAGKGRMTFWDTGSSLVINGTTYILVSSIAQLAGAVAANASGTYALAKNYDAAADGVYSASPIGTTFTGTFEGLGNSISNLSIAAPGTGNIGFFSAAYGTVSDFGLPRVSISVGNASNHYVVVGAITGGGGVSHSWATGRVTGGNLVNIGGLVGNGGAGNSHFTGRVTGGTGATVGGLVGLGAAGNSWSAGIVKGGDDAFVGGLVGHGSASGSHSSATVSAGNAVASDTVVGGLVGLSFGSISACYATGSVTVGSGYVYGVWAGGLVGEMDDDLTNSYAIGTVKAGAHSIAGGLAGTTDNNTVGNFSTGSVSGGRDSEVGGFAGAANGVLTNNYARGRATGGRDSSVGGFAGFAIGEIDYAYSTGAVSGGKHKGGFAGKSNSEFTDAYWDTETAEIDRPLGTGDSSGIMGLTTAQLQARLPNGFDPTVWTQKKNLNGGLPYIRGNRPPV